ncbi:MAG: hypothetical protein J6Y95_04475 [Lachnospiraceae bacterium]|nr:hypothetical protein [Lachnospiraceae bacterium]
MADEKNTTEEVVEEKQETAEETKAEETKAEETKAEETKKEEAAKDPKSDAEENKAFGILAYIGILVLVPILAAPNSKFARYHANQGLILLIVGVVLSIIGALLNLIPYVGWIFMLLFEAAWVILMVLGIVNAAKGEQKPLPVIGNLFTILK